MARDVWLPSAGPAHQEGMHWPGPTSVLFTPHPSLQQVSASKWIHCLSSKRAPCVLPCQKRSRLPFCPCPPLSLCRPTSWHRARARCYLRPGAVTFDYKTFRNSANRLTSYHAPHNRLHEPLGLNHKATAVHQRLALGPAWGPFLPAPPA